MRTFIGKTGLLLLCVGAWGCTGETTIRRSGQIERFEVRPDDDDAEKLVLHPLFSPAAMPTRTRYKAGWGDPIRYKHDVITVQVQSFFANDLPGTLTNSHDVAIFTEIWENGANTFQSTPDSTLTSVVYNGQSELVPGRFNFDGRVAYGPTTFKGYPLRIKFSVLVLQKRTGAAAGRTAQVLGDFSSALIPAYGQAASLAARVARDILKSQPDVISFDYDMTLISDAPEALQETALESVNKGLAGTGSTGSLAAIASSYVSSLSFMDAPPSKTRGQVLPQKTTLSYLRYGTYALIQTKSRTTETSALSSRNTATSQPTAGKTYRLKDGRVVDETDQPLMATHLVFTVTPGQISLDNDLIVSASNANRTFLTSLRQSQDSINKSLDDLTKASNDVAYLVIKNNLEKQASKLAAKDGMTPEQLKKEIDAARKRIESELPPERNTEAFRKQLQDLAEGIAADQNSILTELSPAATLPAAYKADAALVAAAAKEVNAREKALQPLMKAYAEELKAVEAIRAASNTAEDQKAAVRKALKTFKTPRAQLGAHLDGLQALIDVFDARAQAALKTATAVFDMAAKDLSADPTDKERGKAVAEAQASLADATNAVDAAKLAAKNLKISRAALTNLHKRFDDIQKFAETE